MSKHNKREEREQRFFWSRVGVEVLFPTQHFRVYTCLFRGLKRAKT